MFKSQEWLKGRFFLLVAMKNLFSWQYFVTSSDFLYIQGPLWSQTTVCLIPASLLDHGERNGSTTKTKQIQLTSLSFSKFHCSGLPRSIYSTSPYPPYSIDGLCLGFTFCSFVNNLALASNILLADMKSLPCKMLTLRLSGADVKGHVWLL